MTSVRNIFVIGRNYPRLGAPGEPAGDPVVALKPTSAIAWPGTPLRLPDFSQDVQHEIEVTVLIGRPAKDVSRAEALTCVEGYGVGLDLTAFDVQQRARAAGLPWVLAKGFDTAAALSPFVAASEVGDPRTIGFALDVNGERRQEGSASSMIHDVPAIVAYLSHAFSLDRGDVIYTGTPAGARALAAGDALTLWMNGEERARFSVG